MEKTTRLLKALGAPRYSCALAGAEQTLLAVHRAIPILHSGPGCGVTLWLGQCIASGYHGSGYIGGYGAPCTNTYEKEVVFGGEGRLREQIRSTLELVDGDLYMVLTGCTAEIIGDDVASVVKDFQNCNNPVLYAETAGFKGNSYKGYELVIEALISQLLEGSKKKEEGLVNILGIVPLQDVFWKGNLREIKRMLERLGLKVNPLFGNGIGIDAWRKASSAELNILLSPWVGVKAARIFEDKFGVPSLIFPGLPLGISQTHRFMRQVSERFSIGQNLVDRVTTEEEKEIYYYFEFLIDIYNDMGFQLPFLIIADSNYAVGMTKFLADDMGCIPRMVIITDKPPEEYRQDIIQEVINLESDLKPQVVFEEDSNEIWKLADGTDACIILGSSHDRNLALKLNAAHLSISFPIFDRLVLDRTYGGYKGATMLMEDIYTAVVNSPYPG